MHLQHTSFHATQSDLSLFVYKQGANMAYLLYINDIILMASTSAFLHCVIDDLKDTFVMKDLGPSHFFLIIQVRHDRHGFHLHQASYTVDVLDHVGMMNYKLTSTLLTPSLKHLQLLAS
jgi:hypothetical protein